MRHQIAHAQPLKTWRIQDCRCIIPCEKRRDAVVHQCAVLIGDPPHIGHIIPQDDAVVAGDIIQPIAEQDIRRQDLTL